MKKMKVVGCCAIALAFLVGLSVPMAQAQGILHQKVYKAKFNSKTDKYKDGSIGGEIQNTKFRIQADRGYVFFVDQNGDGNLTNLDGGRDYDVFLVIDQLGDGNFTCQDLGFMQTTSADETVAYYGQSFNADATDYSFTAVLNVEEGDKRLNSKGCISEYQTDEFLEIGFPEGISRTCRIKINPKITSLADLPANVLVGFAGCDPPIVP